MSGTVSAAAPSASLYRAGRYALYALFGAACAIIGWRIVIVNLSAHFAQEAETTPAAAATAMAWNAHNADALLREADAIADRDPQRAQALARRALDANPASARAFLVLARLAARAGDTTRYAQMLSRSAELEPQNAPTRLALAELAVQQNDAAAALANLDAAIRARPSLAGEMYPQLLALARTPDGEAELARLLAQRVPMWWNGFFAHASAQADSVLVPLRLLELRRAVDPTPGVLDRQPLIARLASEREWQAAFFLWMNGLTPDQRRAAGNVYNGSFEVPFTATSFDWRHPARNGVEVEALPTFGTTGARALRLAFQGQVAAPRLVAQTLLLDPGYTYELRGRYRLESVRTQFGLQWELACGAQAAVPALATGERLVGTTDWREFTVRFAVPTQCYPQQLALVLRGDAKLDLQATGLAWFDDVHVLRGAAIAAGKSASMTDSLAPAAAGGGEASSASRIRTRG